MVAALRGPGLYTSPSQSKMCQGGHRLLADEARLRCGGFHSSRHLKRASSESSYGDDCPQERCSVFLNGEKLDVKNFRDYCDLYLSSCRSLREDV